MNDDKPLLPQTEDELKALCMLSTGSPKDMPIVKAVIDVLAREDWRVLKRD